MKLVEIILVSFAPLDKYIDNCAKKSAKCKQDNHFCFSSERNKYDNLLQCILLSILLFLAKLLFGIYERYNKFLKKR